MSLYVIGLIEKNNINHKKKQADEPAFFYKKNSVINFRQ